jgi:hypothetical protein
VLLIGEYYKQFHFQEPWLIPFYLKEVWIEEIGSVHDPLFPANPKIFSTEIPDSTYLTCFKLSNTVVWDNSNYSQCIINIILGTEELTGKVVTIFPNPVTNSLHIVFPHFIKTRRAFSIYNLEGILLKSQIYEQVSSIDLDLSSFEKGIYILQIDDNESIYTVKLLKL